VGVTAKKKTVKKAAGSGVKKAKSSAKAARDGSTVPKAAVRTTIAKPLNRSLHAAKATKQDEFYTQLSDIEKELRHYTRHFKSKTVLCNCDDPRVSNFFKYFINNFEKLGLKKVISTCYQNDKPDLFSQNKSAHGIYFEYSGEQKKQKLPDPAKIRPRELKGDGDFRSEECVNLLKQADIVVTNPPFSLFREYVGQLVEHDKKFLIIGNNNAITYKGIFALIKVDKLWLGYSFLLMKPEDSVTDGASIKAAARREIRASGFTIVLCVGDQAADLDPSCPSVLLPNPFYTN
jgi:hypothetical protein